MFTDLYSLALIDVGHAAKIGTVLKSRIGTSGYQAPEISTINSFVIDKTDIFSLACTMFTIMF
jgi:serine/threonine protein kinase